MTNNPTIDGVCKTCLGSGKEYDGAAHTCTACNGVSKPAVETCKVVAWRGVNEYGDIVTEWIDGEPTPSVDLLGRPASYYKVELAYADNLQVEVERLQRSEKNDLIAYKAAIEKQKELREEIKALRDSEDKWYQSSVNLTVERDSLQSTIAQLQARITQLESEAKFAAATYKAARDRIAELESGMGELCERCGGTGGVKKSGGLDSCPDCKGSGSVVTALPAPVAVVLPERMEIPDQATFNGGNTYYAKCFDEARSWNACLDATAALNGQAK